MGWYVYKILYYKIYICVALQEKWILIAQYTVLDLIIYDGILQMLSQKLC